MNSRTFQRTVLSLLLRQRLFSYCLQTKCILSPHNIPFYSPINAAAIVAKLYLSESVGHILNTVNSEMQRK